MLGVRQWRHGGFCVSRQHRLGRPPMTKVFIHRLWNKVYSSVNHEQFPMQMTHKHNKWLQILAQESLCCLETQNALWRHWRTPSIYSEKDLFMKPQFRSWLRPRAVSRLRSRFPRDKIVKSLRSELFYFILFYQEWERSFILSWSRDRTWTLCRKDEV